jgi:uridylate kinase
MKTVVLSLGGSLIVPDGIDTGFLVRFKEFVNSHKDIRFVIVTGGGKTCRDYQNARKEIGETGNEGLDWIGIMSTRLNAELVRTVFGDDAYEKVVTNPTEKVQTDKRVVIGAGYLPGCSSDMDAVLLAAQFGADEVVNLSDVEYVYDKDPGQHDDAKPLPKLTWKEFFDIVGTKWVAGRNVPFDPKAAKEAEKSGISVVIMNGSDLDNLQAYLEGREFRGTVIS